MFREFNVGGSFVNVAGGANEQAYLGGDGVGNEVQIGSRNTTVTKVAAFNLATNSYMHLVCSVLEIRGGADVAEPYAAP